jgi:HK97 family phage prohead protease
LSLSESAWPSTIPLLDSHDRGSVDAKLGQVERLRLIGGELHGRATLSRHNPKSQRIAAELSDGQTFGVSIGYIVKRLSERQNTTTKRREKLAVFDLIEASLVIIPADRHAGIRTMATENEPAAAPEPNQTAVADRAAVNAEIRSLANIAGLGQDFIDSQIDANATVDAARAAAFDAMRQHSASTSTIRTTAVVGMDHTDPEVKARTMGEALYSRVAPSHTPSEQSRAYVGLSIPELARDCLRTRGIQTTGLSSSRVVERALQSTSDFPLLLADTVNRTLRQAYEAAPAGVRRLGRQTTAKDFRAKHRLQFSTAPTLLPVNEHGEFKSGSMAEAQESYSVSTFGRIIGFTRQAMVNDDLAAFTDVTRRMGQAAAAFEANFLANMVVSSPVMSDGKTLFHADHGNLRTGGEMSGAIVVDELSNARQAMRLQKGLLGELISVTPKYLLVGADRETEAEKAISTITPVVSQEVNPFQNKLEVVVDPRLSTAWYVVADPAEVDGLEYAYLEGAAGPQITTDLGFDFDGVRFRVRLDFGGGFVDWRGWFKNVGV